jgi:hypothetical protein
MHLTTPHRNGPVDASRDAIAQILGDLPGKENPYLILSGDDEMTFMQTVWTPGGFVLEFQKGSVDQHYRCERENLSAADVFETFIYYLTTNGSTPPSLSFRRIEVRSIWQRLGNAAGDAAGKLLFIALGGRLVLPDENSRYEPRGMQWSRAPMPLLLLYGFLWGGGLWLAVVPEHVQAFWVRVFRTETLVPPRLLLRVLGALWFAFLTYAFWFNLRSQSRSRGTS